MAVNLDKPLRWNQDIAKSVEMYNVWFMSAAPQAYRDARRKAISDVEIAMQATEYLAVVTTTILRDNPAILASLRMSTCPPLAVDRLVGLSGVPKSTVTSLEKGRLPRSSRNLSDLETQLRSILSVLSELMDPDIFPWLMTGAHPAESESYMAASVIADRLCGSMANPIIRNAQERRQLAAIQEWLHARGYESAGNDQRLGLRSMALGTYAVRMNVPVRPGSGTGEEIDVPIDIAVKPRDTNPNALPILIEAKSAGDYTNVNKRRKEEATKVKQLRDAYGQGIQFALFLCGYFNSGYLGYEAAEGIDWVWEHRIDDLAQFGL